MEWMDLVVAKKFKTYKLNKENGFKITRDEIMKTFKSMDKIIYLPTISKIKNSPNIIGRNVIDVKDESGIYVAVEDNRAIVSFGYTHKIESRTSSMSANLPYVHGECEIMLFYVSSFFISFDPNPPNYSRYAVTNNGYALIDDNVPFGARGVMKKIDVSKMKSCSSISYKSRSGYNTVEWAFGGGARFYGINRSGYEINETAEISVLVMEV